MTVWCAVWLLPLPPTFRSLLTLPARPWPRWPTNVSRLAKYLGEGTSREQRRQLRCSLVFLIAYLVAPPRDKHNPGQPRLGSDVGLRKMDRQKLSISTRRASGSAPEPRSIPSRTQKASWFRAIIGQGLLIDLDEYVQRIYWQLTFATGLMAGLGTQNAQPQGILVDRVADRGGHHPDHCSDCDS